jgi:hypothetical protein
LCPEAVARIEGVHPTTVRRRVDRACFQAKAADREVITGVSTQNVELDELHSFAGAGHPDAQESDLDEVGRHWTHCAMARESRLLLEVVVGPRTQESATKLVEGAARPWLPAIVVERRVGAILVCADPRVRYGQVIKQRAGRRLVSVTRRVIFSVEELIPLKQISTSLLERLNGTIRRHVAPLHRKTRSFAKCRTALDTQTQLFKIYYNLCRKHGSLKGKTPAQDAGLTDHRWTLREMLTFNDENRLVTVSRGLYRLAYLPELSDPDLVSVANVFRWNKLPLAVNLRELGEFHFFCLNRLSLKTSIFFR